MLSTRIGGYIRQNVLGLVAIFIALSGTAYATHPGGENTISTVDIIDGQVKTADLGNGEVKVADIGQAAVATDELANGQVLSADVANDNLTGGDIAPNSLKGADIDESTLTNIGGGGPAGGDLTGTYPNPTIKTGAVTSAKIADQTITGFDVSDNSLEAVDLGTDSVNTAEIAAGAVQTGEIANGSIGSSKVADGGIFGIDIGNDTVTGTQVNEASLNASSFVDGWSGHSFLCDPNRPGTTTAEVDCITVPINMGRTAQLLLIATGTWWTEAFNDPTNTNDDQDHPGEAHGDCHLFLDNVPPPLAFQQIGEVQGDVSTERPWTGHGPSLGNDARGTVAMTTVTGPVGAGSHTVILRCDEDDDDIVFDELDVSVVMLP